MVHAVLRRLAAACCLLLAACLEFDAQQITIRHDEAADRIDVHVVYRGLYAEGDRGAMQRALEQLQEVARDGRFALWCNWPFGVRVGGEHGLQAQALLAHLDVENGGLFTDADGVLCAHQFVRIREAKAFVQHANGLLDAWVADTLANGHGDGDVRHRFDDATKDLVRRFAQTGQHMLALAPGRIELRLPLSARDHGWLRAQLFDALTDTVGQDTVRTVATAARRANGGSTTETSAEGARVDWKWRDLRDALRANAAARFFFDNECTFARDAGLTRFAIGVAGATDLVLTKAPDRLYHPDLLAELRAGKAAIEDGVGTEELSRRFAVFLARDPVLPPELQALRNKAKAATAGDWK